MEEKRFSGPVEAGQFAALTADFDRAERFDKLRVGKLAVYYRDGFRMKAIPYSRMERVFIRIQEVNGKLCCGRATFAYYRMVFLVDGKEISDCISEDEKAMDAALAAIHEAAPEVPVGFQKRE